MHKILLILGLLFEGQSMSGYDINNIIRQIGELYKDLKKANIYYLLDKLNSDEKLKMYVEQTEHGNQKEKFLYTITDQGKDYYKKLLKKTFLEYDSLHSSIDVAISLIPHLEKSEVLDLLSQRRTNISIKIRSLLEQCENTKVRGEYHSLAFEHILHLTDADLSWIDQTIIRLSKK